METRTLAQRAIELRLMVAYLREAPRMLVSLLACQQGMTPEVCRAYFYDCFVLFMRLAAEYEVACSAVA